LTEPNFKPRKLPENAQTPTSRVHAVLGAILVTENEEYFEDGWSL